MCVMFRYKVKTYTDQFHVPPICTKMHNQQSAFNEQDQCMKFHFTLHITTHKICLAFCLSPITILDTKFGCIMDDLPPAFTTFCCPQYFHQ